MRQLYSLHIPFRDRLPGVRGDLHPGARAREPLMTPLAGAATDTGLLREHNEDRYWMDAERGVFLVVDGVGGQAAGELAAQTAVETIRETMRWADASAEERVKAAITAANNRIFRRAQEDEENRGMACVLTLALVEDGASPSATWAIRASICIWDGAIRKLTSATIRRWAKTKMPARSPKRRPCCIRAATKSSATWDRACGTWMTPASSKSASAVSAKTPRCCCAATASPTTSPPRRSAPSPGVTMATRAHRRRSGGSRQ
jgi:hypothetical protein